jgi:hypothetical protein
VAAHSLFLQHGIRGLLWAAYGFIIPLHDKLPRTHLLFRDTLAPQLWASLAAVTVAHAKECSIAGLES